MSAQAEVWRPDEEADFQETNTTVWCYREDPPYRRRGLSQRPPTVPRVFRRRTLNANFHYFQPKRDLFDVLVAKWREDAAYESLTYRVAMSLAYQEMIGLGADALPRMLACLEADPSPHWFWALKAIAREDPAQGEQTVAGAVDAWLQWGRSKNFVPG